MLALSRGEETEAERLRRLSTQATLAIIFQKTPLYAITPATRKTGTLTIRPHLSSLEILGHYAVPVISSSRVASEEHAVLRSWEFTHGLFAEGVYLRFSPWWQGGGVGLRCGLRQRDGLRGKGRAPSR